MKITLLTLFPEFYEGIFKHSIIGRVLKKGIFEYEIINIRDYGLGRYKQVDDYPYGGGAGMVMRPEPVFDILHSRNLTGTLKILMSPSGIPINQLFIKELIKEKEILILAPHYEGVDQRIIDKFIDLEISIGPYVISSGDIAATVIIDGLIRLLPGAINKESLLEESFSIKNIKDIKSSFFNNKNIDPKLIESIDNILKDREFLEYPQYTRPREIDGLKVPEVLLSGDHKKIIEWRLQKSIEKSKKNAYI